MTRARTTARKPDAVAAGTIPPPKRAAASKTSAAVGDDAKEAATAAGPAGWRKAGDVLDRVVSVRTIFPEFNRGSRVGGLPVRRIHTVHGPTHGGKTAFVIGLLRSFADAGHPAALIDAEHSTPEEFMTELFERPLAAVPNLFAERPKSYEETVEKVDSFLKWVGERKKAEPHLRSIIVVDSINKLVPERELKKLLSEGGEALDKGWGRYRAALNQAWLDHLTPLLAAADCALVLIAQEREEAGADPWDIPKVKGGAALLFDASMIMRVSKAMPLRQDPKDTKSAIYGFQHKVRIWKSKVSHMDGNHTDVGFHLSNGNLVRPGFDTARDALQTARILKIVETSGSWHQWRKCKWQGDHRAVVSLTSDPEKLHGLLADINAKLDALRGAA